ncbi:MAG: 4Fe-4S binding protein [Thermodesulfobacteriota bacterium]|nr:4Fe-4S binding protein [Thermodesulfobacteriota bacterium]
MDRQNFLLATLGLVGWTSARHGRLFCNTVCPVGTLLGLVSKLSLFRICIDREACRACGKCLHVCKAGCIDVKTKQVDISRCVYCFNCLSACPDLAMELRADWHNSCLPPGAAGRRNFMLVLAAGGAGLAAGRGHARPAVIPGKGRPTTHKQLPGALKPSCW